MQLMVCKDIEDNQDRDFLSFFHQSLIEFALFKDIQTIKRW